MSIGIATYAQLGQHLFSAGCDNAVQMYDISTGQNQQVAQHDAPIKCVRYLDMNGGMIATASWDKTLKVRDPTYLWP
jgi:mRNA export factor